MSSKIADNRRFKIIARCRTALADTVTPVSLFSNLRRRYPGSILLESSDYRGSENSFSYIGIEPIARCEILENSFVAEFPDGTREEQKLAAYGEATTLLRSFVQRFDLQPERPLPAGVLSGLFGYISYAAIEKFEDIAFSGVEDPEQRIPLLRYTLFRRVIAINHFKSELHLLTHHFQGAPSASELDLEELCRGSVPPLAPFHLTGNEESNLTDEQHQQLVLRCKQHIFRGDVFQIVPSRKFSQTFSGDDFQVYRSLRSLNPSPFLFYYDCGEFALFGSSPEAQLVVKGGKASIFPIAGTYARTGNDAEDAAAAARLRDDPKESSEHVMLVDLARNDLSIWCHPVAVERFKEIEFYSHVIHLVSRVSGALSSSTSPLDVLTATFPAGTLSGAPKHMAMRLLDTYEPTRRTFYGGAIGFIGFNGETVHAILIRSFMSKHGKLHFQAGSGIVADSDPQTEVQEVRNKLAALRAALRKAEEVS